MELLDYLMIGAILAFVGFLISAYYALKHISKNKQAEKLKIYKKQINELQIRLGDELRINNRLRTQGELRDKYIFNCGGYFGSIHKDAKEAWNEYKKMHEKEIKR